MKRGTLAGIDCLPKGVDYVQRTVAEEIISN